MPVAGSARKFGSPLDANPIPVKNVGGSTIPGYGLMEITGSEYAAGNRLVIRVQRPSTTYRPVYLINGPFAISSSSGDYPYGSGYYARNAPAWCLFDGGGGPAASYGMVFGPTPNAYTLAAYRAGFHVQGAGETVSDAESSPLFYRALVLQVPPDGLRLRLAADLNHHGTSANPEVLQFDPMSYEFTVTGQTVSRVVDGGFIRSGYRLQSGDDVDAELRGGEWAAVVGPCDVIQEEE